MIEHIAFIPARKDSEGLKNKNSKFFDYTAQFLKDSKLFDRVIVSTNDRKLKNKLKLYKFEIHHRSKKYSGPKVSIKSTILNFIFDMNIKSNCFIWLFYIPIVHKNIKDFKNVKKMLGKKKIRSVCSFIKSKSHPFNCWNYNQKKKKLFQYIKNDIYRRQDLPASYTHYHYICCFKVNELKKLNSELINQNTTPIFLNEKTSNNLIELDTSKDLIIFKKLIGLKKK